MTARCIACGELIVAPEASPRLVNSPQQTEQDFRNLLAYQKLHIVQRHPPLVQAVTPFVENYLASLLGRMFESTSDEYGRQIEAMRTTAFWTLMAKLELVKNDPTQAVALEIPSQGK